MGRENSPEQPDASTSDPSVGLLADIWRTRVWRIFPLLTAYVVFLTVLAPIKPNLMTDFFASRNSSHYIHCEAYLPKSEPQVCRDAHSTVVTYSSWSDFFSNSFLLFLLAPQVGRWSDAYGRQPFLMLTFVCAAFPVLVLFLNLNFGISMYFYFPAQAVNGALSSLSICMAYVADLLRPEHRAPTFGFIICSFSVGILVGPLGGGYIPPPVASKVALAGLLGCVAYVGFCIPESTTKESRLQARRKQQSERQELRGPWQGFAILGRSALFIKLTVALMIAGVVSEGMYELLTQYFQIKLNFNTQDQSHMFVLAGLCGMFTQLVILRLLLRFIGKSGMLLTGMIANLAQQTLLVFVWSKPVALFAVCLGTIGNLTFPAISSINSVQVSESEQGAVLGALQGARALAQGLGPLVFAGLFSIFTKSHSALPYFPGAPFAFGAVLILIAVIVAATIDRQQADHGIHGDGETTLLSPLLDPEIGVDDESAQEPKAPLLPPGFVLQHSDGPGILMDQMPEIAIEALLPAHDASASAAVNGSDTEAAIHSDRERVPAVVVTRPARDPELRSEESRAESGE